jgi:hypothetical protein
LEALEQFGNPLEIFTFSAPISITLNDTAEDAASIDE